MPLVLNCRRAAGALAVLVILSLCLTPLCAQETELPHYTVLNCGHGCVTPTDPKPLDNHEGEFPGSELRRDSDFQAEGWVEIRLTVAADGSVKNPIVEKAIGPPEFARSALQSVADWRYQPATRNGVPVDRPWAVDLIYRFSPPNNGARDGVVHAYRKAHDLLVDQKYDEAKALLIPVLSKPRLNFYERSMISLELVFAESERKDYLTAREYIEDATIEKAEFVDTRSREAAIHLRMQLDAQTGQFGDALAWFEFLKTIKDVPPDDPAAKLVAKIQERLADPKPLIIEGRIPETGYAQYWDHDLLRRSFGFPKITGQIGGFNLSCDQQEIVSPVTTTARWHVPKDWSNCSLVVSGAPGATFYLEEENDPS